MVPLKSRASIEAGAVFSGTVVSFLFRKRRGGGAVNFLETPSRKPLPGNFPEKEGVQPRRQQGGNSVGYFPPEKWPQYWPKNWHEVPFEKDT